MTKKTPKQKKPFFSLKRLIILGIVCLLIICGLWAILRMAIVKGVSASISSMQSQGYQVEHAGLSVKGFPFKVNAKTNKLTLIAPSSATTQPGKNWSIIADQINLKSGTVTPLSWDLNHEGQMRVNMRADNGETYLFDMIPATINAHAAIGFTGHLKTMTMNMDASRFNVLMGSEFPIVSFENLRANLNIKGDNGLLDIHAEDIILSDSTIAQAKYVLGNTLSMAETKMTISNWNTLERKGAQVWMGGGGSLKSKHWLVKWGAVDIVGGFDIHYKNQKPEGVINLRIKDVNGLVEKMAKAGWINKRQSAQANKVLSVLETDQDDRKTIDLTLKDGKLKYGFITLSEF